MSGVRAVLVLWVLAGWLTGCGGRDADQDTEAQFMPALAPSSPAR